MVWRLRMRQEPSGRALAEPLDLADPGLPIVRVNGNSDGGIGSGGIEDEAGRASQRAPSPTRSRRGRGYVTASYCKCLADRSRPDTVDDKLPPRHHAHHPGRRSSPGHRVRRLGRRTAERMYESIDKLQSL